MTNQIIHEIFPHLSQEERCSLFKIIYNLVGGNYQDKIQVFGIKQASFYYYKSKKKKISDDVTLKLLNLLLNKDPNKFNEFILPIVKRLNGQFSSMYDSLLPSAQPSSTELVSTDLLGFTCSTGFLKELVYMISIMESKKSSKFQEIVLNFADEKVWWVNKVATGNFLYDYGFFTYDYVDECWGNGSVGISAIKLLEYIENMKAYPEVTFWADTKEKTWGVKAGKMDTNVYELKYSTTPTANIKNAQSNLPGLNEDYIPIHKDKASLLKYGADFEISELKMVVDQAEKFGSIFIPFTLRPNPPGIEVKLIKPDNPIETSLRKLNAKPLTLNIPEIQIEHIVKLDNFKTIIKNYPQKQDSEVSLRFGSINGSHLCLRKKEIKDMGVFVSGVLIGTASRHHQNTSK